MERDADFKPITFLYYKPQVLGVLNSTGCWNNRIIVNTQYRS